MQLIPRLSLGSLYLKLTQVASELQVNATKIGRQFVRPKLPKNADSTVNLHLGSGSINHPNFINIDARPASHIHYIRRIDLLSPFKDRSVDLIYACHCLEHFSHSDVDRILGEWYRVLKPGATIRLSVPDFDLILNIYQDQQGDLAPITGLLMGGQDYTFNFHRTIFNRLSLETSLIKAGFEQVTPWQAGQCEMTTFNDWSGRLLGGKYPVSLNLEATKV